MSDTLRAEEHKQHWAVFSTKHTDDGCIIPVRMLAGFFTDEAPAVTQMADIQKEHQSARVFKFEYV